MGLTSDALLNRIAALELHVGIGEHWTKSAKPPLAEDKSLVSRLANLQAKVDRIFIENPELHGLQEIIQTYREDPDNYHPSVLNTTESHQNSDTVINEPRDPEDSVQVRGGFSLDETTMVNAEKQELILISYPTIIECYNLLSQFHLMDIPTLSTELTEKLSLTRLSSERLTCQTIAWQFHLLVVKSIIVIEEFAAMIKHQTLISQSIAKRMQILASKISSLERKRQLENKY
ncbi:hypothetical protein METBIDRAFT_13723 [Metschnikowia bicuspidata var. bicuspidata NRRL YB-4993]|uniref:Uncharacterized protein n=1 Tax=Metschnikowia bicuspidata var. bicuspidata NRRL YB-4993 TaxID=869754 RepID=A0A1A0H4F7_9ASCO|nr:hypothetical protein METBIDRAFT_13723 [Metschnikowia bicuspidata var. bicuspidata NRRL YB-4993]OBA18959.1 hypothetical protein METBIDRAFT_13723 [Metschnikowia bicuspidata var. bicuspidata NRRL YB-4993]